jgi:hypothetical protein
MRSPGPTSEASRAVAFVPARGRQGAFGPDRSSLLWGVCHRRTLRTVSINRRRGRFEARGATNLKQLADVGGRGTPLAKQHRVYLDIVTVALVPDDYDKRLIDFSPDVFANLRLKAFERHDLALAKLGRNQDHDREDVKRLAMGPGLDIEVLRDRYKRELRYQFGNPEHEDLSLDLWCEMITEVQAESQKATTARPL